MTTYNGHDWLALSRIQNELYLVWNLHVPGWAMDTDLRPHRVRLFRFGRLPLFK